jgi:hypothetical protein
LIVKLAVVVVVVVVVVWIGSSKKMRGGKKKEKIENRDGFEASIELFVLSFIVA